MDILNENKRKIWPIRLVRSRSVCLLESHCSKRGEAIARLYSVVETANANGVNAYAYLKLIFTVLPMATGRNPPTTGSVTSPRT